MPGWRNRKNGEEEEEEEEERQSLAMTTTSKKKPHARGAVRMDSCLLGDEASAAALVRAMDDGDLHLFTEIITSEGVGGVSFDVNEEIEERDFSTPLHLAVSSGKDEFVRKLLRHRDIDPNRPHRTGNSSVRFPLHVAAEKGDERCLHWLLLSGADANAKMGNGSTALHVLAARSAARWCTDEGRRPSLRRAFVECARRLVDDARPGINVDAANEIGVTAVKMAADKGSQEFVTFLLDRGAFVDGETEDLLEEKMPELAGRDLSRNRTNRDTAENRLFHVLYEEADAPGRFLPAWSEAEANNNAKVDPDAHDGCYTFLQLACDRGMVEVAEFLINKGADPNKCSPNFRTPPLVLAGHHGYHRLVQLFRDHSAKAGFCVDFGAVDQVKKENVLHRVLKEESKAYHNFSGRNYDRCLALLLDSRQPAVQRMIQPAIDAKDHLGNTPLHVASFRSNDGAVRRLLRCGANIGMRNDNGATPIDSISPDIMEEFLDECLLADGAPVDQEFKLTFKYAFLGPPLRREWKRDQLLKDEEGGGDTNEDESGADPAAPRALPEAEPLWYLSQSPRHRHVLTHPVISSFLCLKWRRIRPYYYVNLAFYLTFVALLTGFVLLKAEGADDQSSTASGALAFFRWTTLIFLVVLAIRELFQALVAFRRYIFSLENLLEVTMIVITFVLILCDLSEAPQAVRYLSASALLLSWAEMVLMLGRHPKLSTFITMFSTVSLNFLFFLTWYSSIIVAFGLTFFIVFQRPVPATFKEGSSEDPPTNYQYHSPEKSLFKTVIMSLTGEMEFESVEFGGAFGSILFLVYVFFVLLVLVNLLNGLAVSDITEIQKHAEIVSHVSRVELISYMESMLLGDPFSFLSNWPPGSGTSSTLRRLPDGSCLRAALYSLGPIRRAFASLIGSALLFQERLRHKIAVFVPNKTAYEDSLPGSEHDNLRLDQSILRDATGIVVRRRQEEDAARLQEIEGALKLVAKQNNHIIELLKKDR